MDGRLAGRARGDTRAAVDSPDFAKLLDGRLIVRPPELDDLTQTFVELRPGLDETTACVAERTEIRPLDPITIDSVRSLALALLAFAVMEPVTAVTHRFVMHGFGGALHRSHHRPAHTGWERNDAYPLMFAAVVCAGLWAGFHDPSLAALVPIGAGITAYGAAYGVVHDVYIHRRLRCFGGRRIAVLERLAVVHELHHRFGGPPYGMLLPVVPSAVRARASTRERVAAVPRA